MEDQHKPTQKSEKVFSFLSKDEVEKLKQEEERKIATLRRDKNARLADFSGGSLNDATNDEADAAKCTGNEEHADRTEDDDDDDDEVDNIDVDSVLRDTIADHNKCEIDDMRNPLEEIEAVFRS
ncbi:protein lap4-like isoform X2 [Teleopsis dalmanni]|uniref:protein lap4-like isoform X2 n=1 Tax=Teleopsis dalmanni TaxID=139649 RepID=UPI0018CD3A21|nr:protein lap4-like isoform X2 [Teleopsis dalmanni]